MAFAEASTPAFREYQERTLKNARALAEALMDLGFTLVSGGTDNHLMLVDLTDKGLTGKEAQDILERAGITVNKNSIPFDPLPPAKASGIRIGTPAVSTRCMGPEEMRLIARLIAKVLTNPGDESIIRRVKDEVVHLCDRFPLYTNSQNGNHS